ncbi:hypothetical protein NIES3974_33030 [Calothrix sp. NIES-3974]|nr:hypothetical protein NIES3974_33030 [Calothrix sp. NIES-3974]
MPEPREILNTALRRANANLGKLGKLLTMLLVTIRQAAETGIEEE